MSILYIYIYIIDILENLVAQVDSKIKRSLARMEMETPAGDFEPSKEIKEK